MDTEGPVSVLDRRTRSSSRDKIIADRITRQRSPGPAFSHRRGRRGPGQSRAGEPGQDGEDDQPEEVIYRISQPYRTSFSARHSVTWGKPDRSRSLSPTSSLRSDLSVGSAPPTCMAWGSKTKRPRGRSKSPKRVTYNTRVTVRHSDTEDSMFTELSSHEDDDQTPMRPIVSPFSRSIISPRYNEFSQLSPVLKVPSPSHDPRQPKVRDVTNVKDVSRSKHVRQKQSSVSHDSGLDYTTELKDLSDQITHMQWSPGQNRASKTKPPPVHSHPALRPQRPGQQPSLHGILKDSQNSREVFRDSQTGVISSGNGVVGEGANIGSRGQGSRSSSQAATTPTRGSPSRGRDKENISNNAESPSSPSLDIILRDYEHDHQFSYSKAIKGDYGEDIQKLAKDGLEEVQQQQQHVADTGSKENGGLNLSAKGTSPTTQALPVLGDEIISSSPVDTSQGDTSPGRTSPIESGRLTPSKRSVSLSITNFLKKVSPHFRRKRSKDRDSKSSSAGGSAQSLPNTTESDMDSGGTDGKKDRQSGRFSRNQVRQSFMKLVGRSESGSKKKKKKKGHTATEVIPTPSHYTIELQDPEKTTSSDEIDEIANGFVINSNENVGNVNGKSSFSASTSRIMKSIEQNKVSEQDIYRRFKDRHSPRNGGEAATTPDSGSVSPTFISTNKNAPQSMTKPDALRPMTMSATHNSTTSPDHKESRDTIDGPMEFFTESDINAILRPHLAKSSPPHANTGDAFVASEGWSHSRAAPPSSLDVMPSRSKRLLQTSVMSSISGDDSIGDCSLDINLTASEPSLLSGISQSGGSKQVVIPQSLVNSAEGRLSGETDSVKLRRPAHREGQSNKENSIPEIISSANSSLSGPPSPVDPAHKPSYLKLSCAVSGYGKYCRYSTYKDVNKRSPYSSQSSLRSDISSPDPSMPAEQRSEGESTPERKGSQLSPAGWGKTHSRSTSHANTPTINVVNGHALKYPTGDVTKDGEYFLQHTQFEEDRIRGLCLRAEAHMRSHDLPEEACGRIRSAIGKANLLLSQKFAQFRDLCHNHMNPEPEEKETKWEDLQGFWDMVKIQVDNVDDVFAEIELMKHNGWQEIPKLASRRSSASSSPKSGDVSQTSTPSATPAHTPGTKRKNLKPGNSKDTKETPESSPERAQKARQAAKARDEARKKLLAERRAAMKQTGGSPNSSGAEVEIFVPDPPKK